MQIRSRGRNMPHSRAGGKLPAHVTVVVAAAIAIIAIMGTARPRAAHGGGRRPRRSQRAASPLQLSATTISRVLSATDTLVNPACLLSSSHTDSPLRRVGPIMLVEPSVM